MTTATKQPKEQRAELGAELAKKPQPTGGPVT